MEKAQITKLALVFTGGVVTGGGVTFLITNAKLKAKYNRILEEEIASVKDSYKIVNNITQTYMSPQEALQKLGYEALSRDLGYGEPIEASQGDEIEARVSIAESMEEPGLEDFDDSVEDPGGVVENDSVAVELLHNIFEQPEPSPEELGEEEDESEELMVVEDEPVDPTAPFIISFEDFLADDPDHDKICISYFEADDTLCDDRQGVIPKEKIAETVGFECLSNFGLMSPSNNIVHVRNPRLETDFEVSHETGAYSEEVLGVKDWDSNNASPKFRQKKMRDDD